MPTPPDRRSANIRLTWQRVIGESISVSTVGADGAPLVLTVPVHQEDPYADPDSTSDPHDPAERAWVEITWLDEKAGRRGYSVVQVDVCVRIGPKDSAAADPYGVIADDIADTIEALFSGVRPDGTYRGWIPMLDFSTTPLAPTPADNCIFVQDPGSESSWGQPSERRRFAGGGFQRVTLRYSMRLKTDATSGLAPWHT